MKQQFLIFLFVLSRVVLTNFVNAYQIKDYLKIDNIDDLENAYGVTPVAEAIRLDIIQEAFSLIMILALLHGFMAMQQ